jgi:hypothetical protein
VPDATDLQNFHSRHSEIEIWVADVWWKGLNKISAAMLGLVTAFGLNPLLVPLANPKVRHSAV